MAIYWETDSFESAWDCVLKPWLLGRQLSFKDIILVPNSGLARQVRSRIAASGKSMVGVHVWTPGVLRQALMKALLINEKPALREDLQWVMGQITASYVDGGLGVIEAIRREPELLVKACDELERAGWSEEVFENKVIQTCARLYWDQLKAYGMETVQGIERRIEKAKKQPGVLGNIILFGFSYRDWGAYRVLKEAVAWSESACLCFFSGRGMGLENTCWQGSWEEFCGPANPCQAECAQPFLKLAENVEYPELLQPYVSTDGRPLYMLASTVDEEARGVIAGILQALSKASEGVLRIGVVFANENSVLAREVSLRLEELGIPHYDGVGHAAGRTQLEELFEAWCAFQKSYSIDLFLNFLKGLRDCGLLKYTEVAAVIQLLKKGFTEVGTSDMAVILSYLENEAANLKATIGLMKSWGPLPGRATFEGYCKEVLCVLELIGWKEGEELLSKRPIGLAQGFFQETSRELFLKWLSEVMRKLGRIRGQKGDEPYAAVQLTTLGEAVSQAWSDLIITELNENVWRGKELSELAFLKDEVIERYNLKGVRQGSQGEGHWVIAEGKSLMSSSRLRRRLIEDNFIKLLSLPSRSLILTAQLNDKSKGLSRLLEHTYGTSEGKILDEEEANTILKQTQAQLQRLEFLNKRPSHSGNQLTAAMLEAYRARRDPLEAFGEYQFCFREAPAEGLMLSCKEWEMLLRNPAQGWMKSILGINPHQNFEGTEISAITRGTWVHRLLTLPGKGVLLRPSREGWHQFIESCSDSLKEKVAGAYHSAGRSLPEWWLGTWARARRIAKQLAEEVAKHKAFDWVLSEEALTEDGMLLLSLPGLEQMPVRGRVDIVGVQGQEAAWVVDFKTGAQGGLTLNKIGQGEGLQLALYAMAYREMGYQEVSASVLRPGDALSAQLSLEALQAMEDFWRGLARIQKTGIIGQYGPMHSTYQFTGDYPLATLAIEESILAAKWAKTHPELGRK